MSTFFCALKYFLVSQFKVPPKATWWKLRGQMKDLRKQNFRNTIMQTDMDMTIIAHNCPHLELFKTVGAHLAIQFGHHNQQASAKQGGHLTAPKTQKLNNLGQEIKMQTLCREEEDGEDLDRDGRLTHPGIGLVLDLDVLEELQMQT